MFRQPALAGSALEGLHDELLAYLTLFSSPEDLLALANVNSVFYVFSREEPLWMLHCLRLHGGDFTFYRSWRLTTFFPRPQLAPKALPEQLPVLTVRNFGSDFLYRRWCRSHMSLRDFVPPSPDNDPFVRRIHTFDVRDLSYQDFYEQYACVPFILKNAITKWKAARDWTMPQLATRFADPSIRHRLTHNLDTTTEKDTQMTFSDYHAYLTQQRHDETPLYIFDPRFGEKMPSMLGDYDVSDLRVFQEDLLQLVADTSDTTPAATMESESAANKAKMPKSIRPDFRWIVMGPERSGAPWHTDPARTSAWNALVKGRKRWAIYPPGTPPPGIAVGKNAQGREHALNMTSLYWYLHVYPTLLPHQRPLEVVQEEGDVIYVPSGWWHLVLNLDEALAVTQNFVDSHNLLAFVNDLLDDQQHEALQIFQHAIQKSPRKEISDVCRLVQIPRMHGYLKSELYLASFRNTRSWKTPVKSVLKHHKLSYEQLRQRGPLTNLTARVNPTFAIGNELLIKFYSELNQDWGEFDFTTYLSPDFEKHQESPRHNKKRKTVILSPHELKTSMTLRFAMEECFRIEKTTYQMIQQQPREELLSLQQMVPRLHHTGHLLDVSEVDDEDGEGLMWRWPYTIMEFKRGLVGISSLVKRGGGGATMASWQRLATWLNEAFLPKFHAVAIHQELRGLRGHSKATWEWYEHYLLHQRKRALAFHLKEDAIPPQLINCLESFLLPATADAIADHLLPAKSSPTRVKPVLLHGDLTDENVLGTLTEQPRREELSDLKTWLQARGFAKYVPLLVDQHELTMASMELLTESHLQELGVPLGPRLELLQAIASMRSSSSATCGNDNDNFSDSDSDSDDDDEDGEDDGDDGLRDYVAGPAELEALQATRLRKFYGTTSISTNDASTTNGISTTTAREWTPTQVIDFADAKTGDPLFDLVAMFFSALHCDRQLWRMALETRYWQQYLHHEMAALQLDATATARVVRERFLRLTLLHPSRSIKSLFHFYPQTLRLMSWQQVAEVVFGDLFAPQ